jgi:hypothetical protein
MRQIRKRREATLDRMGSVFNGKVKCRVLSNSVRRDWTMPMKGVVNRLNKNVMTKKVMAKGSRRRRPVIQYFLKSPPFLKWRRGESQHKR